MFGFARGDGHQVIEANGGGTLVFGAGITASDVYLQANGSSSGPNLDVFFHSDPGDSIHVVNDFLNASDQVTTARFADGTTLDLTRPAFTYIGTGTGDVLTGSSFGSSNTFEEAIPAGGTPTMAPVA